MNPWLSISRKLVPLNYPLFEFFTHSRVGLVMLDTNYHHHDTSSFESVRHQHVESAFPCHGPKMAVAAPPRDGPIVPSNCKTHLTCKPVHPNRADPWTTWSGYFGGWFSSIGLILAGSAVVVGGCIYGKGLIDKNRKKRRDARLVADGRKPPTEGDDSDDSGEDDARGQRG